MNLLHWSKISSIPPHTAAFANRLKVGVEGLTARACLGGAVQDGKVDQVNITTVSQPCLLPNRERVNFLDIVLPLERGCSNLTPLGPPPVSKPGPFGRCCIAAI